MKTFYLLLFTLFILPPVFGQGRLWSTFAGKAGGPGRADGAGGSLARFDSPCGIAADGASNVYVILPGKRGHKTAEAILDLTLRNRAESENNVEGLV